MFKVIKNKEAIASIVEVVVSAVVFSTAAVGIFSMISILTPRSSYSTKRLEAAYTGKRVIEELKAKIDARLWDDPLSGLVPGEVYSTNIGNYLINWHVSDLEDLRIRQLLMDVYYLGDTNKNK